MRGATTRHKTGFLAAALRPHRSKNTTPTGACFQMGTACDQKAVLRRSFLAV